MLTYRVLDAGRCVRRQRRPVLSAAGTLAFLVIAAAHSAWAEDAPLDPYSPPPPAPYIVTIPAMPDDVEVAIDALKRACAAWPPPAPFDPALYSSRYSPPPPLQLPDPQPKRDICTAITDPERAVLQLVLFGGSLGAVLMVVGLVGFCWLRGVLVSLWAGHPAHVSRSF